MVQASVRPLCPRVLDRSRYWLALPEGFRLAGEQPLNRSLASTVMDPQVRVSTRVHSQVGCNTSISKKGALRLVWHFSGLPTFSSRPSSCAPGWMPGTMTSRTNILEFLIRYRQGGQNLLTI